MPRWYEVFDNEEVLYRTRSHILWLSGLLLLMVFFGMAITSYLIFIPQPLTLPVISTYVMLSLLSVGIALRIYQLRKTVWCIKLSEVDIIGYTHSRRRITLPWEEIKHINLTHHGLLIVSQNPSQKLFIPHAFTSYHVLSHQLVALAETYQIPVLIHGKSVAELDIHHLYPYLASDRSTTQTSDW